MWRGRSSGYSRLLRLRHVAPLLSRWVAADNCAGRARAADGVGVGVKLDAITEGGEPWADKI